MERAIARNLDLAKQSGDNDQAKLTRELKTIFERYKQLGLRDLAEEINEAEVTDKYEEIDWPPHADDEAGWESQLLLLTALGYHDALGMSEEAYRASLPSYQPQPKQFEGRFDTSLLVDPRIPRRRQMQLVGVKNSIGSWLDNFEDVPELNEPYQVWVQNGIRYLRKNALTFTADKADDERGMNSLEAITLYRELPNVVLDHGVILPGSTTMEHYKVHGGAVLTMGRAKDEATFRFHFANNQAKGKHIYGPASCGVTSR